MKVIIPAAGMGKRLRPQTNTKPKPMVNVAGKTIIGHILDRLKGNVEDVVLVVGYQKEKLIESVTTNFSDEFNFSFVEQRERKGLGHAIFTARDEVGDSELLINLGDEIFGIDYSKLIQNFSNNSELDGLLGVKRVDKPWHYGIVEESKGKVTKLVEKPENPKSNLAIAGIYLIRNTELFFKTMEKMVKNKEKGKGGEYQLTDALQTMVEHGNRFGVFEIDEWYDCGRPEMLLNVNRVLLEQKLGKGEYANRHYETDVVPVKPKESKKYANSLIIEPAIIGKNCKIENSIIGPYVSVDDNTVLQDVHISDSIIGSYCQLNSLLLKNSIIDDEVNAKGKPYSLNAGKNSSINLG